MGSRAVEIGQRFSPPGRLNRVFVVTGLKTSATANPEHAWIAVEDDPADVRLIACDALRDGRLWQALR